MRCTPRLDDLLPVRRQLRQTNLAGEEMPLLDRQRDGVRPPVLLTTSNVMTAAVKSRQSLLAVHTLLMLRAPNGLGGVIVARRTAERLWLSPKQDRKSVV